MKKHLTIMTKVGVRYAIFAAHIQYIMEAPDGCAMVGIAGGELATNELFAALLERIDTLELKPIIVNNFSYAPTNATKEDYKVMRALAYDTPDRTMEGQVK